MGAHVAFAWAPAGVVTAPIDAAFAGPEHAAALLELFERSDVPCYCRYWHFDGNTNAWLDRCAHHVEQNRAEMRVALEDGSPEMSGVVATSRSIVIGWMKLAPASSVPKLYSQRLYRALPCFEGDRDGVFTIGCILVDPAHRRTEVATRMLECAIRTVRERGGRAIEAFPRRAEGISDAEAWTGPFSLYERTGFQIVHDFAPYPVMRLAL